MSGSELGHGKLPAGSLDNLKLRLRFKKLKPVAEGTSLACEGMNFHIARRQGEFQPDDLSKSHFITQHGGDSRLADVHRVAPQHGGIAAIDTYLHIYVETGMTAGFSHCYCCFL